MQMLLGEKPVKDLNELGLTSVGNASVEAISASNILTRATGFMSEYDFTLNPYSGCSFGCTYCYAASFTATEELRDTWGEWVKVKANARQLLSSMHKPSSINGKRIYMSSVTDPYQPAERKLEVTRGVLSFLAEYSPKLVVQTRSPDVLRDLDLFHKIEENGGRVQVNMTVTTDDEDVRKVFEPQCPSNGVRLRTISAVAMQGVETCITLTPLLYVKNHDAFVDSLLETGVKKFIVQPFHFKDGTFVANTREGALDILAEKFGCASGDAKQFYLDSYSKTEQILSKRLPSLGKGKSGFSPPF